MNISSTIECSSQMEIVYVSLLMSMGINMAKRAIRTIILSRLLINLGYDEPKAIINPFDVVEDTKLINIRY